MRDFQLPGRSAVYASNGVCATSHPLAAAVAVDILKSGGNAVDAAVAGAVLLGLCEPAMTGIGGDCFALIQPAPDAPIEALNGSGRAPAAADAAALREAGEAKIRAGQAASVTIPGAVDGFCQMIDRHGRLGLDAVLAPAIRYAEEGVPVAPRVAFDWANTHANLLGVARDHYLSSGAPLAVGDTFRAPGQAEVLRRIAREGRDGFYQGEVMEDILAGLPDGAPHKPEDFAAQNSTWSAPIFGPYGDLQIVEHPPNGQGTVALLMLEMLAQFDLAALDPLGPERAHLEAEITKAAYATRNGLLADPSFMDDPAALQAPGLAARLAAGLDLQGVAPPPPPLQEEVHRDTIYITVVDRDRMAVSLIYSIFQDFGSGLASPKFGILLHGRGAGFTLEEGHPNEYGPRKRPVHTILPGMVQQAGQTTMAFGVMGAAYQPTGHARVITNMVDYGMDPQEAIDAPRTFATEGVLRVERGYSAAARTRLETLGHDVVTPVDPIGGAQAIAIDHDAGVLIGASDPRKDGIALGY